MNGVNPDNYIVIQGWMISDLKLKGNDLLVYAIIYGFTQDGEHRFTGGLQYLANWTNSTKSGVQKNLANLVSQGLLLKETNIVNGVTFCYYRAVVDGMQQSCIPIQQSCINNKINNKIEDKYDADASETFLDNDYSVEKPQSNKKKNLYQKCLDMIYEFTNDSKLTSLLIQYLDLILEKYRSEGKVLYANQFKGMLNRLVEICTDGNYNDVVQQSIYKQYIGFYPVSSYKNKPSNPDTNKAEQHIAGEKVKNADGSLKKY